MTRKENLLLENYRLTNELNTLRGRTDKMVDLDMLQNSSRFYKEAKESTVSGLTYSNDILRKTIESEKQEMEHKAAVEAFYATEEGQARKAALEHQRETAEKGMAEFRAYNEDFFRSWIKQYLGDYWTLRYLCDSRIEFAIVDPHDDSRLVFGQTIEIYFERRSWSGAERFETNVGTTGTFELLAAEQGDRARFYIDLGRFLSDKKELEEIKELLFGYKDCLDRMHQQLLDIRKELENPASL